MQVLNNILEQYFGYNTFREGQEESIEALLLKDNVISILPTGQGKSLIYLIYALYTRKRIMVIVPLTSIIDDQCEKMKKYGIPFYDFTGNDKFDLDTFQNSLIFYTTPEKYTCNIKNIPIEMIQLIVIDEVHVWIEWKTFRNRLENVSMYTYDKQMLLLSATLTSSQISYLTQLFVLSNVSIISIKPNIKINYIIKSCRSNTSNVLIDIVKTRISNNDTGIIYANSISTIYKLSEKFKNEGIYPLVYYSSLEKNEKKRIMKKWNKREDKLMIATTSFVLGVDNPHVTYIINYGIMNSITEMVQAAGRGGRETRYVDLYIIVSLLSIQSKYAKIIEDEPYCIGKNEIR